MTWIDATSILFAMVTIFVVVRSGQELKQLLTDARYERLEINRRLEKLSRRVNKFDGGEDDTPEV